MTILLSDPRVAALPDPVSGAATRVTVDLAAVAANTRRLARCATGELMAVVKADGFGHGAAAVARTALAGGATRLGVTGIDEALALRAAGLTAPVLSWLNPLDADYGRAVAAGVELAVPTRDHLAAVCRRAVGAAVHLHLDTGLARDGAAPSEWADLCRAARRAERRGLVRVVGVMGHLAVPESPRGQASTVGRARFAWGVEVARAAGLRPTQRHLAATAATLADPASHHTMCRVGAGLVGIDPSATTTGARPLTPAMTLETTLVSVRRVRAGTPVGYGHTWSAPATTHLGLLPLGYADGLPRTASGRAEVLVRGRRRPLVGLVSMDMAVVDLGPSGDGGSAGDVVTVFGPGRHGEPTAAEWAGWAATIEHEIVTGLGARVGRIHRPAAAAALRSVG